LRMKVKRFECFPRGGVSASATLIIDDEFEIKADLYRHSTSRRYSVRLHKTMRSRLREYCAKHGLEMKDLMDNINDLMQYRFLKQLRYDKSNAADLHRTEMRRMEGTRIHQTLLRSYQR
jgi:hypothetical protein